MTRFLVPLSVPVIALVAMQVSAQITLKPAPTINAGAIRQVSLGNLRDRFPSRQSSSLPDVRLRPNGVANFRLPANLKLAPQVIANLIAGDIQKNMAGKSVGFAVTVMMADGSFATASGGAARRNPDSAPRGWTGDDRITIASVSKTITGATLIKLMNAKGLSLDMPAWQVLPASWTFAPSFKTITIRELLAHTSGIRGCSIDYDGLKACAAAGVNMADKGTAISYWTRYSNANYALMRLIIPRVQDGSIPATPEAQGDRYEFLVNQFTFGPAGVGGSTCAPPAVNPALSYISTKDDMIWNSTAPQNFDFTTVKPGQPWGEMKTVCGSQGWNLSSRQLATFAHALWQTDKILPQPVVDTMRAQNLSMIWYNFGDGLEAYGHGGYHPAPNNQGEINTLILGFNNGISIGAIVNSRYNGNIGSDIAAAIKARVK